MKRDLDGALENIDIIKNSIGEAKENKDRLYNILMILGLMNLAYYGIRVIAAIMLNAQTFGKFYNISYSLNIIAYAVFFIYYAKMYKKEKFNSNKYYLGFLNVFAGVTFLLPVFMSIINKVYFFAISDGIATDHIIKLLDMSMLSNILLLCFSIIICGYILKKKSMFFLSVVILFVYMILSLVYSHIGYTVGISETPVTFSLLGIYYYLAISVGYIFVAMLLKHGGNNTNGNK